MNLRIAIVAAPYHPAVAGMILTVRDRIAATAGAELAGITTVAGAFEIPLAVQRIIDTVDGVVALGAIERGETGHGTALANAVFPALMQIGLTSKKPVGLGIIGPNATREQIESRAANVANEAIAAVLSQLTAA